MSIGRVSCSLQVIMTHARDSSRIDFTLRLPIHVGGQRSYYCQNLRAVVGGRFCLPRHVMARNPLD
jgi:hypothetical protein